MRGFGLRKRGTKTNLEPLSIIKFKDFKLVRSKRSRVKTGARKGLESPAALKNSRIMSKQGVLILDVQAVLINPDRNTPLGQSACSIDVETLDTNTTMLVDSALELKMT